MWSLYDEYTSIVKDYCIMAMIRFNSFDNEFGEMMMCYDDIINDVC